MTTINRNEKGEVSIDREMIATILPKDQSMISIFGTNGIVEDGVYSDEDHMIYLNGKPFRKMLTEVYGHDYNGGSGVKVWIPVLKDVVELENRYWRQVQAQHKFHHEKWLPAYKGVEAVGTAHAKISHEYYGDYDPWWLYNVSNYGIGFDWVDKPEKPKDLAAGQTFYDVNCYSSTVNNRKRKFKLALEKAIAAKLDEITGTRSGCFEQGEGTCGQQIVININDRQYWYHAVYNRHGVLRWEILSWPSSELISVQL